MARGNLNIQNIVKRFTSEYQPKDKIVVSFGDMKPEDIAYFGAEVQKNE